MRSEHQIIKELVDLIKRYVKDQDKKSNYINEITQIDPPPVRGIFSEMDKDGIKIKESDADLVHDVFFYFG